MPFSHRPEYEMHDCDRPNRRAQRLADVEKHHQFNTWHPKSTSSSGVASSLRPTSGPTQAQHQPADSPMSPASQRTYSTYTEREVSPKEKYGHIPSRDRVSEPTSAITAKKPQALAQRVYKSTAQAVDKSASNGRSLSSHRGDYSPARMTTLPTDPCRVRGRGNGADVKGIIQSSPPYNEIVDHLIRCVSQDDYAAFAQLITEEKNLINGDEAFTAIVQRRRECLQARKPEHAEDCLKTAALIKELRGLSYATATHYLRSLIDDNDHWVRRDLREASERERRSLDDGPANGQRERKEEKALSARTALSERKEPKRPDAMANVARTSSSQTEPHARIRVFQEQTSKWFVKGKFFKAWKPLPLEDHWSRRPRPEVIYLFLVAQGYPDQCMVVQARSFWQRGRRRSTVRASEKQAVAAPRNTSSKRAQHKEQQATGKDRPIMISLSPDVENIDPETWIDFSHTIPLHTPLGAKEIGNVDADSMEDLEKYWRKYSFR